MGVTTASGGVTTAPKGAPGAAPVPESKRKKSPPAVLNWVEEIAGMAMLTGQTAVSAVTPPYNWGGEFLEQS
jgi:phospholipid/cholesterol/gamma-HCH transport system permease protein